MSGQHNLSDYERTAREIPKMGISGLPAIDLGVLFMRIIARRTLIVYWTRHPETEQSLRAWYDEVRGAKWGTPTELKATFGSASILKNGRVVFNVCGNKHRLVVAISFAMGTVFVKFIGTHPEYDAIDAQTIEFKRERSG